MKDELTARHYDEKHATEPITEIDPVTIYYGRKSMVVESFVWCPTCGHVYPREHLHATMVPGDRELWQAKVRASDVAWRNAMAQVKAYRNSKLADAARGDGR